MTLKFDPTGKGLAKVLRDYQIEALRFVWEEGETGVNSREVWQHVNKSGKISRASVINFLSVMVDEGVLNSEEQTCKGGTRRVYTPRLNKEGFKKHIAETVISSLIRDFPEETNEALNGMGLI